MKIVGIETSGMRGGIALLENETVRREAFLTRGMVHGKLLVPALAKACKEIKWRTKDIDLVAVNIGPGSYTGLRVGLAVAKTMAYVLKKALIGVPSLDAMAAQFTEQPPKNISYLCPVIDAKWHQVYTALYKNTNDSFKRVSDYLALQPEGLVKILPINNILVFGDGLKTYHDVFKPLPNVKVAPLNTWLPKARHIALLGYRAFKAGQRHKPERLIPLYLRPTEAEMNLKSKRKAVTV